MLIYFFVTLAILGAWFALALLVGSFLGRLFKYGQPTFEAQGRERVGLYPDDLDARRRRAQFRAADRWSKSA